MARRKNAAAGPAAAFSAALPVPVPGTEPDHDSRAAAIYAALTAHPGGATTAVIAGTAGISRPAARDALAAMERAGAVARTRGGKPGVPDIWTCAIGIPRAAAGQIAQRPAGGQAGHDQHGPAGQEPARAYRDEAAPAAGSKHHDGTGPAASGQVPGVDGRAGAAAPDPAVVTEITRRIERILAAASAAAIALAGSGNMSAVRAGLDEIWEQAAQARRALKAAAAGKKAPAARPGALREKILGHLRNHPGEDFSPHEIHQVLGNSPGAIADALDTLAGHGQAELASGHAPQVPASPRRACRSRGMSGRWHLRRRAAGGRSVTLAVSRSPARGAAAKRRRHVLFPWLTSSAR